MVSSKKTTTLILGATGNTGRRLVEQLLDQQQNVKAVVRSKERFHEIIPESNNLHVIEGAVLDLKDEDFQDAVKGCDAVVSCLGHNMTFKGMYGQPRKLCTDAIKRVCEVIQAGENPTKVVLMGSNGVANPNGMDNVRPFGERALISCLRVCVPPVKDNEDAAAFLSKEIGKDKEKIEWVVVRPDDLIEGEVSDYEVLKIPGAGLFGGGQTTRANVAHFMSDLILNDDTWKKWLFEMPVPTNI